MNEWERQIARDAAAGKLDKFAEEAKRDCAEGRATEIL
jgi:hypothetical protein